MVWLFSIFITTCVLPYHDKNVSSHLRQENNIHQQAQNWDVKVNLINFSFDEERKISTAVSLIKKVIRSSFFRERVLAHEWKGEKTFNYNQGLSNEAIYKKIIQGAEFLGEEKEDYVMDVELELYQQKSNTIGYTYPNTKRIWINRKYFSSYNSSKIANNLMHEWMHKLGFDHESNWTKDREYSIPYAIGDLVEELTEKISENRL
jgi:hypothetical protein